MKTSFSNILGTFSYDNFIKFLLEKSDKCIYTNIMINGDELMGIINLKTDKICKESNCKSSRYAILRITPECLGGGLVEPCAQWLVYCIEPDWRIFRE